jgi:hypothetical protein
MCGVFVGTVRGQIRLNKQRDGRWTGDQEKQLHQKKIPPPKNGGENFAHITTGAEFFR